MPKIELRGASTKGWKLYIPDDNDRFMFETDKAGYEAKLEKLVLDGFVIVINCHDAGLVDKGRFLEQTGVVSLRWGAQRLLLLTPAQVKRVEAGEELRRIWRLWRYQFDPKADAYTTSSPNTVEKMLQASGLDAFIQLDQIRRT